ncbi:MAG TPA: TetR/AcrR family transcriptional regulator [Clostridia bacterium]|nr:TetR/AcrR family transcriptional regulator [Clostridia bacterium]
MENILPRRERERQVRKSEMIEVAEKLFIQNGYEGTSMDDIAKEAQFTKRTIYQYFINKDDLFYAVALKFARQLNSNFKEAFISKKTALEKIHYANLQYFQFFKEHPEVFQLINHVPQGKPGKEVSPNYIEMLKFQSESFQMYTEIIEKGKKDGSMSPDLDAKKAAHFGVLTVMAYMNTMSKASNRYFETYGFAKDDFILFGLKMITETLAPKSI